MDVEEGILTEDEAGHQAGKPDDCKKDSQCLPLLRIETMKLSRPSSKSICREQSSKVSRFRKYE